MKPPSVTIAIVTKNRPKLLAACLTSLTNQTTPPTAILVIDQSRHPSATKIRRRFPDLPIRLYRQPKGTVPKGRNLALSVCRTTYLGFIDDDCLVDPAWVTQALRAIISPKTAYALGKTQLKNPANLVAFAQYKNYQDWLSAKITHPTGQIKAQAFDTKNVLLRLAVIKQRSLTFDPQFSGPNFAGVDDVDFGLQLSQHGLVGRYCPAMQITHPETTSLWRMLKKAYQKGKFSYRLAQKWHLPADFIDPKLISFTNWRHQFWLQSSSQTYLPHSANLTSKLIHTLIKLYERSFMQGYLLSQSLQTHSG
jgi:GT2 family glycosyltransferase